MRNTTLRVVWGILILLGLSLLATDAFAHDAAGGCGYGYPYSLHHLFPERLHSSGQIPVPPYFAIHPPVYYSLPVARTYGYSPYAYPPGTKTPDIPRQRSKMILNKFVVPEKEKTTGAPKPDRVTATPRRITNPYVGSSEGTLTLTAGR